MYMYKILNPVNFGMVRNHSCCFMGLCDSGAGYVGSNPTGAANLESIIYKLTSPQNSFSSRKNGGILVGVN